jgi:hypothetical protein
VVLIVDVAIELHSAKSHLASGVMLEETQGEIGSSRLRIMNGRGHSSRRWIRDATSQQFSTRGKKNRVSIDDPTRTLRKEGEQDGAKKRRQRDESKELLGLQGADERRME